MEWDQGDTGGASKITPWSDGDADGLVVRCAHEFSGLCRRDAPVPAGMRTPRRSRVNGYQPLPGDGTMHMRVRHLRVILNGGTRAAGAAPPAAALNSAPPTDAAPVPAPTVPPVCSGEVSSPLGEAPDSPE